MQIFLEGVIFLNKSFDSDKSFYCEKSELCSLLKYPGEYFTLNTAEYFLGTRETLHSQIVIISSRRRRPKNVGRFFIRFIYCPEIKKHNAEIIKESDSANIAIGSIETILLDYLQFYPYDYQNIAKLFFCNNFDRQKIIKFAQNRSDTVFKRTLFYLAWLGCIDCFEIEKFN